MIEKTTQPNTAAAQLDALLNINHPLKQSLSKWASEKLPKRNMLEHDRTSQFDREAWQLCADVGILGANTPINYGGSNRSLSDTLLILEGLGHGCEDNGLVFSITSQLWSTQNVIQQMGSDEQKSRWLPGLVNGSSLGAFAISEPESGSDTYALAATAEKQSDGTYQLNGHKAWLTLGAVADIVVVFANSAPGKGAWGISAFVVETSQTGVELLGNQEKMGMRTAPFGDIRFNNVRVNADQRLGPEGIGMGIFNKVMEADRAFVLAGQIGAMQRQLEQSIAYSKKRKQFGSAIRKYQAVAHRIADMKVRHEVARTMMYKTALLCARGQQATLAAAVSKIVTSEAGVESGMDAIRIFGAKGYVSEYGIDRQLRDFTGAVTYSGTTDIQRNLIARLLGTG